jgi:hypothetical protein
MNPKLMKELDEEYDRLHEERERLLQMLREARTKSERASILGKLSAVSRKQHEIWMMGHGIFATARERTYRVPTPAQAKAWLEGGERLARLRRERKE